MQKLRLSETGLTTWSLYSTCPAFSHTVSDTGATRDWREAKTPRVRTVSKLAINAVRDWLYRLSETGCILSVYAISHHRSVHVFTDVLCKHNDFPDF